MSAPVSLGVSEVAEIIAAQRAWAADFPPIETLSDDGCDYATAAFRLAADLMHMWLTCGPEGCRDDLERMLNTPYGEDDYVPSMSDYACDGICPTLYNYDPPCFDLD